MSSAATRRNSAPFVQRHIGPNQADTQEILDYLGYESSVALADDALPKSIRQAGPIGLPEALDETDTLATLRAYADKNVQKQQLIGNGYFDTITPAVIRRNVVENPGWYTAYTPYQPEISQGRLEALLNFQTMVQDLTGLDIANASLLDEASAAAEAVGLMSRAVRKGRRVLLDARLHPQVITVAAERARAIDLEVEVVDLSLSLIHISEPTRPY